MAKLKINIDIKKYPLMCINGIKSLWHAIPDAHRASLFRGFNIYIVLAILVAMWIGANARETINKWESKQLYSATIISSSDDKGSPDFSASKSAFETGNRISIIISRMGMDVETTYKAINELPKEVVLAFSPYAPTVRTLMDESYNKEHENIILVPMESASYPERDAGNKAMSSKNSIAQNLQILDWATEKDYRALGVMNFMGSFFLKDKIQTDAFLKSVENKKIMLIENRVTSKSQIPELIKGRKIKYLTTDMKITEPMNKKHFMIKMTEAEAIAKNKGHAVVVMDPYPLSMDLIKVWAKSAKGRGFTLASLSSVWKNIPHNE